MSTEQRWPGVVITLWHYVPRSKGARVVVTGDDRHIVSSASYEGMTIDDPNITQFLDWAKGWYEGAPVREVTREAALRLAAEALPPRSKRGRPRKAPAPAGPGEGP